MANATLTRFFSLHFLFPFVILALVVAHVVFLHEETSSNPLGVTTHLEKIHFFPYYAVKDLAGIFLLRRVIMGVVFGAPLLLRDRENAIMANPLVTPAHIQPEWYFLFAYAILRSTPRKLGGVVALALSVTVLYILPLLGGGKFSRIAFYPVSQTLM